MSHKLVTYPFSQLSIPSSGQVLSSILIIFVGQNHFLILHNYLLKMACFGRDKTQEIGINSSWTSQICKVRNRNTCADKRLRGGCLFL